MDLRSFLRDLLQWQGPPSVKKYFSVAMFVFGVLFYFIWNSVYGWDKWADPGVYSVTVVTLLLGLTGMFLFTSQERRLEQA